MSRLEVRRAAEVGVWSGPRGRRGAPTSSASRSAIGPPISSIRAELRLRFVARFGCGSTAPPTKPHSEHERLLGRLTPVVRSFISIPAGALQSPLGHYTMLTLIGSAIWCFGFALVGRGLGNSYDKVHHAFTGLEVLLAVGVIAASAVYLRRRCMRPAADASRT